MAAETMTTTQKQTAINVSCHVTAAARGGRQYGRCRNSKPPYVISYLIYFYLLFFYCSYNVNHLSHIHHNGYLQTQHQPSQQVKAVSNSGSNQISRWWQ